jgi:hypothetical protein
MHLQRKKGWNDGKKERYKWEMAKVGENKVNNLNKNM